MMQRCAVASGVAFACLLACEAPIAPQSVRAVSETLVWEDQFDGQGLPDPSRWDYEVGLIRNNERQYYTRGRLTNARVHDGKLVIEAHKEAYDRSTSRSTCS